MPYALESSEEFARLERQSEYRKYDYRAELRDFRIREKGRILDAGCGSGVVARYLGKQYPTAAVIGCDFSPARVKLAAEAASGLSNVAFQTGDLTKLPFKDAFFDGIVCRYVLEHLSLKTRARCLLEFYRCLKPAAKLYAIDFDGPFVNLFPRTPLVDKVLNAVEKSNDLDLHVGRKMPWLLEKAGFNVLDWRIETIECRGSSLKDEFELLPEKFDAAFPLIKTLAGGERLGRRFVAEFLETLRSPGAVLFYNKFIVVGQKRRTSFGLIR